jgi:ribonuclease PH
MHFLTKIENKDLERRLKEALSQCIKMKAYPKCVITFNIEIVENSGCV